MPGDSFTNRHQLTNPTSHSRPYFVLLRYHLKIKGFAPPPSINHEYCRSDKSADIAKVIAAIESREIKDYSEASWRFEVDRTTISKRIRRITRSRKESICELV